MLYSNYCIIFVLFLTKNRLFMRQQIHFFDPLDCPCWIETDLKSHHVGFCRWSFLHFVLRPQRL